MTIEVNSKAALIMALQEAARSDQWTSIIVGENGGASFKRWRVPVGRTIAVVFPEALNFERRSILYDWTPKLGAARVAKRASIPNMRVHPVFEAWRALTARCGYAAVESYYEERVEHWRYFPFLYKGAQENIKAEARAMHRQLVHYGCSELSEIIWDWIMAFNGEPTNFMDVYFHTEFTVEQRKRRLPWGWRNDIY